MNFIAHSTVADTLRNSAFHYREAGNGSKLKAEIKSVSL